MNKYLFYFLKTELPVFLLLADNNNSSNAQLWVSFIGYETPTVPALSEQTISLQPDTTLLSEVVVEGYLPRIKLRSDAVVTTIQSTVHHPLFRSVKWCSSCEF